MKRTERDWFAEPERPRHSNGHTVIPMPTRSDEPPDVWRAALFLSGAAVGAFLGALVGWVAATMGAA